MCPLGYRLTALVETGDFTLGARFKEGRCRVLYLYFQLKLALPMCALAIKALAVSARAASREHRRTEEAQGGLDWAGLGRQDRIWQNRAGRTELGRAGGCAVVPAWGLPTLRGGCPALCLSPALQLPAGASRSELWWKWRCPSLAPHGLPEPRCKLSQRELACGLCPGLAVSQTGSGG